ncbi:MAG: zf-HC2 domain-containing protein, partial [Prevotella sp.]
QMTRKFAGCKASNFTAKKKGDYAGVFVFYLLTHPNGKTEKSYVCVRNDNDQHIWIADGGL